MSHFRGNEIYSSLLYEHQKNPINITSLHNERDILVQQKTMKRAMLQAMMEIVPEKQTMSKREEYYERIGMFDGLKNSQESLLRAGQQRAIVDGFAQQNALRLTEGYAGDKGPLVAVRYQMSERAYVPQPITAAENPMTSLPVARSGPTANTLRAGMASPATMLGQSGTRGLPNM